MQANWKVTDKEFVDIKCLLEDAHKMAKTFREPVYVYRDLTLQRESRSESHLNYLIIEVIYP